MNSGLYIAIFYLSKKHRITVGRFGIFDFTPGFYFYVGSAKRNLSARLDRHARKEKPLRWHIDYLSTKASMLGAITIEHPDRKECKIAADLAKIYKIPIPTLRSLRLQLPRPPLLHR